MKNAHTGPSALLVDAAGVLQSVNTAAAERLGRPASEVIGKPIASLFEFEVFSEDPELQSAQWEALRESALDSDLAMMLLQPDGTTRPCLVRVDADCGASNQFFVFLGDNKAADSEESQKVTAGTGRWDELVERGSAGFFDLNFADGTAYLSPMWKRMLGYVDAELPNSYDTWTKLLHPDDSAAAPDHYSRKPGSSGKSLQSFAVEYRMQHREGHWLWLQCQGLREFSEHGALVRVSGFQVDISERKELEEASMANDERLRILSEEGQLGCFEFDFVEGKTWISNAFKEMLGYAAGELPDTEESFLHLLENADLEAGLAHWFTSKGALSESSWSGEVQLLRKDGSRKRVQLGIERQLSRKRELLRVTGFCVPVTSSAAQGQPSAEGDKTLSAYLDEIAEGVLATDEKGKVSYANACAQRLIGADLEHLAGQPLSEVFPLIHAETGKPAAEDPCELALASEGPLPLQKQHFLQTKGDQGSIPVVWTARALFGQGGRANSVVLVFRNPEEMRLTPEELVKANRFESLALLAGGIAHDFNNLLTTILGGISLAKDTRNQQSLEDSEKSCLAAKALTKQLLAFAKGGAGVRSVVASPEILRDSVKIAAAGSTVSVTVEAPESLPPVLVDRSQILQVFQNLIVNSIQAMPPAPHKGSIALRAESVNLVQDQVPPLAPGNYLRFEVRDNGSGIKPEYLEKIWDPFFTTKKHGTGLGLATVLSIVRKHGGNIGVESELGLGTVFTVFLPAANQPVEMQARRAPSLRYGTGRILFMDDDPKISSLTAGMLESLEYKYDLAKNGEEALKLYRSYFNIGRPYDVVIMDLTVIGGMGGEDAFKAIREVDPEVRAIAASGYDNEDMARRFLDLGFCGYLTKPYRVTDLGKVIKTVIG